MSFAEQFGVKSVANEIIDAKLAAEELYNISVLIDQRFGHGTWQTILTERNKRIEAAKEAQKEKQDAARAAAIDPSSIEDSPGEQTPMTQAAASNNPKTSGGGSSGMAAVLDMMDDG